MYLVLNKIKYLTTALLVVIFFIVMYQISLADSVGTSVVISSAFCGNNIVDIGEDCDGNNLNNQNCVSLGFDSGVLACTASCAFNLSNCSSIGGGGGGGGGGGSFVSPPLPETKAIFIGKGYPGRTVTLLKDAQIAVTTVAGSDANFEIELDGLGSGNYVFSLYSTDKNGLQSSLVNFPLYLTEGASTTVSGIFIAPTIDTDKVKVKKGGDITIFGQVAPLADVVISVHSDPEYFAYTISDSDGTYLYTFDTSVLEYGQHQTKAKGSISSSSVSGYGTSIDFEVAEDELLKQGEYIIADLDNNHSVGLIDFSIAAYWYGRELTDEMKEIEKNHLNGDGIINLIDFSIMAYHWTG